MQDTSIEIKDKYRKMLLNKAGIERMIMGSNMAEVARTMVLASIAPEKNKNERRVKLFLRIYGNDFSSRQREDIVGYLRGGQNSENKILDFKCQIKRDSEP
jgi:hypothetical protein